jgi:hypothetical protein
MANLEQAKKDAVTRSQESKKTIFVSTSESGDHLVADKQSKDSIFAFKDGNEVPLPEFVEKAGKKPAAAKVAKASTKKAKTNKKMATKVAPKKAAAKKESKPASGLIGRATTILLSKTDWAKVDKAVEAGKGSIRELSSKGILRVL